MNLENSEIEAIAGLKDQFGYKMLLDRVQAEIDTLHHEILEPGSKINQEMILFWRALNRILIILRTTPEYMDKELKQLKTVYEYSQEKNQLEQVPKEYLETLLRTYEQKKASK